MMDRAQRILLTVGEILAAVGAGALYARGVWSRDIAVFVVLGCLTLAAITFPRAPRLPRLR